MEKLCQNVWRLPAVQDPGKVLHGLLVKTAKGDRIRDLILDAVRDMRCLPPNPRRIKGLANLIGRLSPRLQAELNDLPAEVNGLPEGPDKEAAIKEAAIIKARIMVIVAYIYQFHADIYVRWEAELDLYDKIFDWCGGAESHISILNSLVLPTSKGGEGMTREQPTDNESTYPDPTDTNVFWIQPLILKLGTEVPAEQFKPVSPWQDNAMSAATENGLTLSDLVGNPTLRAYLSNLRDWHGYFRFLGLPDRRDNPDILIDRLFVEPLLTRPAYLA